MTATKTTAKKVETVKAEVKPLSKPQVRILEVLVKSKTPLTLSVLAEKAAVDRAWVGNYVGRRNAEVRNPESLLSRKAVVEQVVEGERGVAYLITATGKKLLEAAKKAAK